MPLTQPQQVPLQSPVPLQPQVIIAQPSAVQSPAVSNAIGSKKNFLLPAILIVVLLILGGAIFLLKDKIFQLSIPANSQNSKQQVQQTPQDANCTTGFEGNAGNNFCSNYHGGSSQCRPGMPDDYPDGCTR